MNVKVSATLSALMAAIGLASWTLVAQPRSAQGDCVQEANRLGYTVLETGKFQQYPEGWRLGMRVRDARGAMATGTCSVDTRTGQVTIRGFGGSGGGGGGSGAMTFECASDGMSYRECQLPIDGTARLVKRRSKVPCTEGQSWGQRGDRVWVDKGCRAEFEVTPHGGAAGGGTLDCRSQNGLYRECTLKAGYSARLVRDYTGRCRHNSTWGTRPGVLWVTDGCQGRFELVRGSGGNQQQEQYAAGVACRNEAQRQYITVRTISPAKWRGSYWQAAVQGQLRGQAVVADCRVDPRSGQASIFIDASGGSEGGSSNALKIKAEQACMAHAKRVGYAVTGQSAAVSVPNGLRVALTLTRGNALFQASCFYETRSGQTRLDQVRPQPR